jgi:hypothetical protein
MRRQMKNLSCQSRTKSLVARKPLNPKGVSQVRIRELIERLQELERMYGNVAVAMPDELDVLRVGPGMVCEDIAGKNWRMPNETDNVEVVYVSDRNADGKKRKWWETPEYCAGEGIPDPLAPDDDEDDDDEGEEWKKGGA